MGGIQGTPFTPANQRPMRPNSKDGHMRPDLPSPMQVGSRLAETLESDEMLRYFAQICVQTCRVADPDPELSFRIRIRPI